VTIKTEEVRTIGFLLCLIVVLLSVLIFLGLVVCGYLENIEHNLSPLSEEAS